MFFGKLPLRIKKQNEFMFRSYYDWLYLVFKRYWNYFVVLVFLFLFISINMIWFNLYYSIINFFSLFSFVLFITSWIRDLFESCPTKMNAFLCFYFFPKGNTRVSENSRSGININLFLTLFNVFFYIEYMFIYHFTLSESIHVFNYHLLLFF